VGEYVKIFEEQRFFDTMVSLKAASPQATIIANRLFAKKYNYPLHVGVTATGPFLEGVVKSSLGIGTLLSEGIGDIIRVSLTAPSFWEIRVAKYILQATGKAHFYPEIISCPTCSRCEVDLIKIVKQFQEDLLSAKTTYSGKIALMGCEVNGPGEARQADIGVAFGARGGVIFRKDKILGFTSARDSGKELLKRMGGA